METYREEEVKIIENTVREEYNIWKNQSPVTRFPKAKITWAEQHGIHETTLTKWDRDDRKVKEGEKYNSEGHLLTQLQAVDADLILACRKGNAQALKIFFQRTGLLVEKPQEIHIFNANDYIEGSRGILEKLRADFIKYGGPCPVCGECKSVRYGTCVDSESEYAEDREVATLALPAGTEQHNTEV